MAEGYKAWSGGQVLDAGDLTDYASSQAVMRFASAATRDAALTVSVVKEGMLAYLKDTNVLTVNTDGTTTGWVQIYPVITATIADSQVTNAKLAANSVTTSNIVDGTITGTDIASATIQPGNVANGTYGISISGNAATATSATSATSASSATNASYASLAGDADLLNGLVNDENATGSTIVQRTSVGAINGYSYVATGGSVASFRDSGTYTYLGLICMRVNNSTDVYSQPISGGRTVLVNSNLTLGTSTSSRAHKEDITPLAYDTTDILALEPVSFRYKAEHVEQDATRPVEIGLIAEDVAAQGFDELVYRDKDGKPDGIAYEKIAVLLLKVCQDQQKQLAALAARLDKIGA